MLDYYLSYCEEASSIFQQSLKWVFKEQKIGNNKSLFTCTATFGAATASDECLQKKAAKNNAATKLMPKILTTYGCPQAKQQAKKRNAQTSGRGGRGGKRGRRTWKQQFKNHGILMQTKICTSRRKTRR